MSDNNLGINNYHQENVLSYLKFARFQREYRLRSVRKCFQDIKEYRLQDTTFTLDECNEILDELCYQIGNELEGELINSAHMDVLLLRQLFIQAEKCHLKLNADISQLENRHLLDIIKAFEESKFGKMKVSYSHQLDPINDSKTSHLLKLEVEKLNTVNAILEKELKEKNCVTATITETSRSNINEIEEEKVEAELELAYLNRQIESLKKSMIEKSNISQTNDSDLTSQLTKKQEELMNLRNLLDMSEKELEKKVSMTAPFKNMKIMLLNKNEKIKQLRRRLSQYEVVDT